MKKAKRGLIMLIFLLALQTAYAQEFNHLVSNSEDWKDVYSTMLYASLENVGSDFLVNTRHGAILLSDLNKNRDIRVVTSRSLPYVFNYPDMIRSAGFQDADEIVVDSANIELIDELPEINTFIVVGDGYGYNAVAVTPYAIQTNSWVFLANRENIFEVESVLNRRNVNSLLIYGYVDREVREALEDYNPEIIDSGDRFRDNTIIVEKYLEVNPTKQAALTNGEFLEKELMSGVEPVLFTGRQNVPDQISEYIKNSQIDIGVLIGNELVGAATNIRRTTGMSVMVKFARGARGQAGGIAPVEGLDLYPIPTPYVMISLYSIKYNKVTKQLEVTYKSDSNVPAYMKGTITVLYGDERVRVGDSDTVFIAPGDYKTVSYPIDIPTNVNSIQAEIYTLFGEAPSSLDRILEQKADVEIVEVLDKCRLTEENIKGVKYNKQKNSFFVVIKNTFDVDCWVDAQLNNLLIGSRRTTIGTEGSALIESGKTKRIQIEQDMSDEDLQENPFVDLTVYSGEREDSLVHSFNGKFELEIERITIITYVVIVLVLIVIILIMLIVILKRKEKKEEL
jgi:hypothetical protein